MPLSDTATEAKPQALPQASASRFDQAGPRGHTAAIAISILFATLAGCTATPAEPVPFRDVPAARIVRPGYTQPADGLVAVDVRRERSRDLVIRFRDALVYVDGEQVADLMNGEHVTFYLRPGVHRIGVSTQFDPVVELRLTATADSRYVNRASITFGDDHRIALHQVAR